MLVCVQFYEDSVNAGNCWRTAPEASLVTLGSQAASSVRTKGHMARKGNEDVWGDFFDVDDFYCYMFIGELTAFL